MSTENSDLTAAVSKVPVVSRRRRVFAKAFGIPGLISAIISMWFTVAQSLVAITASGATELFAYKLLHKSISSVINIPLLTLCFFSLIWAVFAVVLCVLSRFLGTSMKINQTGFILSVVSSICSVSLACFSIVYMILA